MPGGGRKLAGKEDRDRKKQQRGPVEGVRRG